MIKRYQWSVLNRMQVGAYAEYFVKMEFTMHGFQVYTTEVDDRGIDFVIRSNEGRFFEVQVKSVRGPGTVFLEKEKFKLSQVLYLALVYMVEGEHPTLYLVPSEIWNSPNKVFVSRDYGKEGQKSKPEWAINLSRKNISELDKFKFETVLKNLI